MQPHIFERAAPMDAPIVKHKAKVVMNQKHTSIMMSRRQGFFFNFMR